MEAAASERLREYVERGGVLVLTGPWPGRNERGRPMEFLGLGRPASLETPLGAGKVIWRREPIAQEKPEEERLESIAFVASLLGRWAPRPHVRIRPVAEVSWVDWQEGGGHRLYRQPRNLGSAVLQRGPGEAVLFVLNHYPEAACFEVEFPRDSVARLTNLVSGEEIAVTGGRAVVDIDRKSAEVFRVE